MEAWPSDSKHVGYVKEKLRDIRSDKEAASSEGLQDHLQTPRSSPLFPSSVNESSNQFSARRLMCSNQLIHPSSPSHPSCSLMEAALSLLDLLTSFLFVW